jgi:hypothetical protein
MCTNINRESAATAGICSDETEAIKEREKVVDVADQNSKQ